VFDKTGTLTIGKPQVVNFISFDHSEKNFIKYAASLESKSEHPISTAIVEYAKGKILISVKLSKLKFTLDLELKAMSMVAILLLEMNH